MFLLDSMTKPCKVWFMQTSNFRSSGIAHQCTLYFRQVVRSANCPFGKMSLRQNVRPAKRPSGKTSVSKMSVRQNVFRQSVFRQNACPGACMHSVITFRERHHSAGKCRQIASINQVNKNNHAYNILLYSRE